MAAEGYYRVTNKLAAVNVTTGPGGTNAITGVYGAYVDSMAMIVISGQSKWETLVRSTSLPLRQLGDHRALRRSVGLHDAGDGELDLASLKGEVVRLLTDLLALERVHPRRVLDQQTHNLPERIVVPAPCRDLKRGAADVAHEPAFAPRPQPARQFQEATAGEELAGIAEIDVNDDVGVRKVGHATLPWPSSRFSGSSSGGAPWFQAGMRG